MKKYLIRTALVLAAITACNKEIDTQLTSNTPEEPTIEAKKVTLTIKASIEAETRTAYENDQKATWQVDDKITVCVTNSSHSDFLLYDLKAEIVNDELVFAGEVDENYTTVVSGIYPANPVYKGESMDTYFGSDGSVIGVNLPDTYDLDTDNDTGRYIPMVGAMDENDNFVFHHICGALKITVVDIFNALTFTTAGEKIAGLFSLNSDGHIALNTAAETATDNVTFNYDRLSTNPDYGERGNRTFFIPVPYGDLADGATMALKKSDGTTVYEKTTSRSITFSNKIMRLSAINLQTPEGWKISVTEGSSSSETGKYIFTVPSGTKYVYTALSKSSFESDYQGSVAAFIEEKALTNTIYTTSGSKAMKYTMDYYYGKEYIILICGVTNEDGNRRITFNYCLLDYQFPTEDYLKWIGQWSVNDGDNTDTWTITRKETNNTYFVSGLCNRTMTAFKVEAHLSENGSLLFKTQKALGKVLYSGYEATTNLYRRKTVNGTYNAANNVDLMQASLLQSESSASLSPADPTYPFYTLMLTYTNDQGEPKAAGYGTRSASASMTRVTPAE